MSSIARRIWRSYFLLSVCIIGVMVSIVVFVNERQEDILRELTLDQEREFFLAQQDNQGEPVFMESPTLTALFLPDTTNDKASIPAVFDGLPGDYFGEIEHGGRWYLVDIDQTDGGHLYFAWDITRHEQQETLFMGILAAASLGILVLSFILSVFVSRRLTVPLRNLTGHIHATPVGQNMPRLSTDYRDSELAGIAGTFNHFLDELEAFVKREHSLVSLASHELRTPVAVISGALDVMETRGQLHESDAATLRRVRNATREMEENVNVLLKLARRKEPDEMSRNIPVRGMIMDIVEDLASHLDVAQRVHVEIPEDATITAHPVLAKMLLRNLIKNALEHTGREVWIRLKADRIEIDDAGSGLSQNQRELLTDPHGSATGIPGLSGLGLYIATLVCEHLEWQLKVERSGPEGTTIHVVF